MTPNQINRRRQTIEKHLSKWNSALSQLRDECNHINVSKKYNGSTGNYDPNSDCYWIAFRCLDCGKSWIEDQ